MTIDCILRQLENNGSLNAFPLITYKIGTIAAWTLHAYSLWYSNFSTELFCTMVFFETISLFYLFLYVNLLSVDKVKLLAQMNKLGSTDFLKTLNRDLPLCRFVITCLLNYFRIISMGTVLYTVYKKVSDRSCVRLKEKDVVLLLGSSLLIAFNLWAIFRAFELKNKSPDFYICFKR